MMASADLMGVYPRAGGGTNPRHDSLVLPSGLSPRRRGNRRRQEHLDDPLGSIPAQAGEPAVLRVVGHCFRVYPRAGGGTERERIEHHGDVGLSPRRRGNPAIPSELSTLIGSIPAQAGEPTSTGTPG